LNHGPDACALVQPDELKLQRTRRAAAGNGGPRDAGTGLSRKVYVAPGEYIGHGRASVYSPSNSVWSVQSTADGNGVHIVIKSIDDTSQSTWHLQFKAPAGARLEARIYAVTGRAGVQTATGGLDIFGNGRHCINVQGTFVVREIAFEPGTSDVSSLAIDFEQRSEQSAAPPLTGRLRFNSTIDSRLPHVELGGSAGAVPYNGTVTWSASATRWRFGIQLLLL
jgi:hypothetical protein